MSPCAVPAQSAAFAGGDDTPVRGACVLCRTVTAQQTTYPTCAMDAGKRIIERTELSHVLSRVTESARRAAERDWSLLDLQPPELEFEHEEQRELHVAKLRDEKSAAAERPHIVVFIEPFGSLHGEPLDVEMRHAIAHAMGHAFLRSLGLAYDPSEENAVERFARLGKTDKLFEYLV